MNSRPTKKTVEPLLDEWARNALKCEQIEAKRDTELQPLKQTYEKKCAPILEDSKTKLKPLQDRMKVLRKEIETQLRAGVNEETGTIVLPQVSVEAQLNRVTRTAIAEVQTGEGDRVIDPQKFFAEFKEARRDVKFWNCVKVLVGKAEKEFGALVSRISKKPTTYDVVVKLQDKEEAAKAA